jgi:dihydroorotate dehydrogenase electron transfer subunit
MLAALAKIAGQSGIACEVSLENHMACGFGVCFSCVTPIRQPDGSTDLKRVCVEGPIFPAEAVDWAAARH